jgi:hypothetical protein
MSKPFNFYQDYKGISGEFGFPTAIGFLDHFFTPPTLQGNSFLFSLLRDSQYPTNFYSNFSGESVNSDKEPLGFGASINGDLISCLYDRGNVYSISFSGGITSGDHYLFNFGNSFNGEFIKDSKDIPIFSSKISGAQTFSPLDKSSLSMLFTGAQVSGVTDIPSLWSDFYGKFVRLEKDAAIMELGFLGFNFSTFHVPTNIRNTGQDNASMSISFGRFDYTPM